MFAFSSQSDMMRIGPRNVESCKSMLKQLDIPVVAEDTGGKFYEKDSTKLKEAFQSIAEDLKYQYLIGFYPRNTKTGGALIKVAVMRTRH